ncbi:hypothetical protein TorRG33x02_258250 [Trema orientale]|uniref:Uncharacterized protein n=1 Tax=Trema orientale TaxID=63057 RepID=A0A2P5D9B8_TREOI|nr:hypothetical protein TorRG33x02_258250 [Trema orientale]
MAPNSEIPSNNEMEGYAVEVKALKPTIKDCESYIKTLNKEIVIDEGIDEGSSGLPNGWKQWDHMKYIWAVK